MNKNVKIMGKTVLSGVLVLSLILGSGSFAAAKKISKQESVYVNAGADGQVTEITVADWLKNSGLVSGTVKDSSDLTDIINVKGEETYSQSGKSMDWSMAGEDIYYQGKTTKELPVELKLTYFLDGQEMTPQEMLGKSGTVKIKVSYENHSSKTKEIGGRKTTIYTPFVMVTGMILSSDNFTHVEIDNGRVINDGSNQIVVGMGIPGLAESLNLEEEYEDKIHSEFTVTAEVTDFSMGNTFTYASAGLLDELNLDGTDSFDEVEEKLSDLTDAVTQLADGSKTLSESMSLFSEKMGALKTTVKKYEKDGVKKVTSGINTFAKGNGTFTKGVKEYVNGADSLAGGTTTYVDGASQIASGCASLYEAVKDLPSQIKTFDQGLKTYTGGVDELGKKENVKALKDGAKAVSSGITEIHSNLAQLKASFANNEALIGALEASGADAALIAQLKEVTKTQKAAIEALEGATSADGTLKKGAEQLSSGVNTVMDSLSKLSGNSSSLTSASQTLNTQLPVLVENIQKLKEGGKKLTDNEKKLLSGAKALIKAGKTMKKSVKKVNKGMKTLQKGGKALNQATGQLVSGIGKLSSASEKLDNGAEELKKGMAKLNEQGVKKINRAYEKDIKTLLERIRAISDAGKEYKSFSGIGKGMDGEVKFIIETEEVKKDDE
ncbi:MAG: hypothetical protein J1F22_02170 [Lachnospiraceae bacterium]|nr:hypothetical protein [Lachnospiraceae bacterium]